MAGAEARAVVAVEVLVKQQMVAPVRIGLKFLRAPEHRSAAVRVALEDPDQPLGYVARENSQTRLRAVRGVEFHQRFDQQVTRRKPHGTAPVRIAALQLDLLLGWLIAHVVVAEDERMVAMIPRQTPNARLG